MAQQERKIRMKQLGTRGMRAVVVHGGTLVVVLMLLIMPGWTATARVPAADASAPAEIPASSTVTRDDTALTPRTEAGAGREGQARDAYANLPLYFVENRGQIDERVAYYAQQGGASLYFTAGEMVMALPESVLRLRFVDANPGVRITGADEQEAHFSFFLGNDPDEWRSGIPSYGEVVYHNLYPGVDLRYTGRNGALKYEFLLRPGADVAAIHLAYAGAGEVRLAENGDLLIVPEGATDEGALRDTAPYVYQEMDGARVEVAAAFTLHGDHTYGFRVGGYDPRYPLVIDPQLLYSTFLGGSGDDHGAAIAVDGAGNACVTGYTYSGGFPTTAGAHDTGHNGESDVFVSVLDPTLGSLLYSTFLGGSSYDYGLAIALDGTGNAYVAGRTESSGFPITAGAYDTSYNGSSDVFVSVLDPTLSSLLYATFLGGSGEDYGAEIALDGAGNAHLRGFTYSSSFPTTAGAYDTSHNGATDVFVSVLDPSLSSLLQSTFLGGSSGEYGGAIALDGAGNAYVTGYTDSSNFPTTAGAYDTSHHGESDVFVSVLDPTLSNLLYSTFLGRSDEEVGLAIALDGAGNAYLTGWTGSSDFPTTAGAYDTGFDGGFDDVFVSVLDPTLSNLLYSTFLGGSSGDYGYGIALDGAGNAYVAGDTYSSGFPTTARAHDGSYNGDRDVFVSVLDPTLSNLLHSTFLGGSTREYGTTITLDGAGNAYVTGHTLSSNFPTTAGAYDGYYSGSDDAFVSVLRPKWSEYWVHLPLVVRDSFRDRYEPNDTFDQAWGPLASGQTYRAFFPSEADENDFYFFELTDAHSVEIWLSDILPGNDHALYLYDPAHALVDYSDNYDDADEHIVQPSLPAGRYYVRVERFQGTTRTQPYALRVVFAD
jgi:hypothetical protein